MGKSISIIPEEVSGISANYLLTNKLLVSIIYQVSVEIAEK